MTPTKKQYDDLVEKYGKVSVIEIEGDLVATFHYNLDRNSLSKALSLSSNEDFEGVFQRSFEEENKTLFGKCKYTSNLFQSKRVNLSDLRVYSKN